MKKIHSYRPDTRVYTDSQPADLDELETAKGEGDVWLLPAHATFAEPPTPQDGMVALYDTETDSWDVVAASAVPSEPGAQPPSLEAQIVASTRAVDQDVDAVIFAVIGNRATEYLQAEQEAQSYLEAASEDAEVEPPPSVLSDMAAFGHTATEAAESILAQATAWRQASNSMRARRLMAKQEMAKAGDVGTLAAVFQSWRTYINNMRTALGA